MTMTFNDNDMNMTEQCNNAATIAFLVKINCGPLEQNSGPFW